MIESPTLPVTHSVVNACVEISSSLENVAGEDCTVVWANHALIQSLVSVHSVCHYLYY